MSSRTTLQDSQCGELEGYSDCVCEDEEQAVHCHFKGRHTDEHLGYARLSVSSGGCHGLDGVTQGLYEGSPGQPLTLDPQK